jgi:hypothetical protein
MPTRNPLVDPLFLIRLPLIDPECFALGQGHAGHQHYYAHRSQDLLHSRLVKMGNVFALGSLDAWTAVWFRSMRGAVMIYPRIGWYDQIWAIIPNLTYCLETP